MKLKLILGIIVALGLLIQFIPIDRENPPVSMTVSAPDEVMTILQDACFDCHSNETVWPWYTYTAPMKFLIANHVKEGRSYLNFSEWDVVMGYDSVEIANEIIEVMEEDRMPIKPYRALHPEARLEADQIASLVDWAETLRKP